MLAGLVRPVACGRHVLQEQAGEPEEEGTRGPRGCGCGAGGRRQGQGGPRDRSFRAAGSRVAISRAGRRPPAHRAVTESKTCACVARRSGGGVPSEARWDGGCGAGGHGRPIGGRCEACRAWPGFEATRRAKLAAWTVSGRAGLAPRGDLAGCAIVLPRLAIARARTSVSYSPQVVLL